MANASRPAPSETIVSEPAQNPGPYPTPTEQTTPTKKSNKDKDDEFSDSEPEESGSSKSKQTTRISTQVTSSKGHVDSHKIASLMQKTEQASLGNPSPTVQKEKPVGGSEPSSSAEEVSEFKAMAADASVFSFGDDEDEESE